MNWKLPSPTPIRLLPVEYLPVATDFTDIPKRSLDGLALIHECPKCHGHGQWNLRLHAFGPGSHFRCSCGQCSGWGYVAETDRSCLHEYRELSPMGCLERQITHHGMCWHVVECVHCGRCLSYDSGDWRDLLNLSMGWTTMERSNLLTRGNGKLGEGIHAWSIPAVETCPGRSTLCERVCYARSGRFRTHLLQERLAENLDIALADDFVHRIVTEVRRRGVHTLRIHVSGDFFNAAYARQWLMIARRSPHTTFYGYTRSWRVPEIVPALEELARLRNVRLWYSCDAETGRPEKIAPRIRLAYLQTAAADTPAGDLVFRIESLRATPARRIGLSLVCPRETGHPHATAVTCTSCRRCHG